MTFARVGQEYKWVKAILELPLPAGRQLADLGPYVFAVRRERAFGPVTIGRYLFDYDPPHLEKFDIVPMLKTLWRLPAGAQVALVGNAVPDWAGHCPVLDDETDD